MSTDNSRNIASLPLFPLSSVLFPGFQVQLHIFEERYRVMIRACIENNTPFGVVLIQEGQEVGIPAVPHNVGCLARIVGHKTWEDGRINLLAIGEQRFRLLDYWEAELPYLVGSVEFLDDDPVPEEQTRALVAATQEQFWSYLRLLSKAASFELPEIELPSDPTLLAFYIASVSQLSQRHRQQILETTFPMTRLEEIRTLLAQQIKELRALRTQTEPSHADEAPVVRILIARPLDKERADWQQFRRDSRN